MADTPAAATHAKDVLVAALEQLRGEGTSPHELMVALGMVAGIVFGHTIPVEALDAVWAAWCAGARKEIDFHASGACGVGERTVH